MNLLIETERLILRELSMVDVEGMFELDSDPEVHLYLGNSPVKSIEQSKKDIEFIQRQYENLGIGRWAVIEKDSGNFVGWAGLKRITQLINNQIDYYDLGYRLIKKFWGKGYATEAAKASVDYGFNEINLDFMIGIADIDNLGSIHVLEKVGLKKIELFDYGGKLHHWMRIDKK